MWPRGDIFKQHHEPKGDKTTWERARETATRWPPRSPRRRTRP
nr:MAG TPA: hypothetical protein [Caudoviricetes sp.]